MPSSCPALPTPTPPRRRRLPRPSRSPRPRRPPRAPRGTPVPGTGRVYRLALLSAVIALAIALVPDLGVDVRVPGVSRPAAHGSVTDVTLDLGAGTLLGGARIAAGRLQVTGARRGSWLSAPLALGGARMVALSWDGGDRVGSPAAVWARTFGLIGWSRWEPVDADDTGPDPGGRERPVRGRGTSEGFWAGTGARWVQVRVDLHGPRHGTVAGLAAHLIDPGADPPGDGAGDAEDAATAEVAAGPAAGTPADLFAVAANRVTGAAAGTALWQAWQAVEPPTARGAAHAAAYSPRVVHRRGWGADERLRRDHPRYAAAVRVAFLHHTGTARRYGRADAAAIVRATYLFHTRVRGYNDLGYNFLIDRFGRVFEGRAGGVGAAVVGAHTSGFNTGSVSVALIGHYGREPVPAATQTALRRLLAWKLARYRVDPNGTARMHSGGGSTNRYRAGTWVRLRTLSMHRDVSRTSCPGAYVARLMPALRAAVARTMPGGRRR